MKKTLLILMTLFTIGIGYSQTVGDTFVENFITYEVTSITPDTVEVVDYDHSGSTDIVLPATVTNSGTTYNVTSIGDDAFDYNGPTGKITSVIFTLPSNITNIGIEAFRDQNLTTVTIPSSVISIGQYAFWHNNLTSITIQNGLESIGAYAFSTNQITNVIIPNSVINIDQAAFQNNQITTAMLSNNLITIGASAFSQNQLQSIVIPDSVTSFSSAFSYNQLTSLTLPNSITEIGISAFRSNSLTHVTIPSTVTNIGNTAFRDNPLATVTSQATTPPTIFVPGINDSFWNRSVIDLTIPSGTSGAYIAGGWTGFNSVTEAVSLAVGDIFVVDFITYEVTSIAPDAVEAIDYDMAGGTVVNIPASVINSVTSYDVTSIDFGAFQNNSLTSVIIPNSVMTIKGGAFKDNALTSVTIPDSVTFIGEFAFQNNLLSNVIIGSGVTNLDTGVFQNNQLTNITIPNTVTTISNQVFYINQITSVTIPASVTSIGVIAFVDNPLSCVISENINPPTIFAATFETTGNSAINLSIPSGTASAYAAAQWTGFNSVAEGLTGTFVVDYITYQINANPNNEVTITGYNTAGGTVVNIPATVVSGCTDYSVTIIGNNALSSKGLTSVSIPNSVTAIELQAFNTNSLTGTLTIPDSVITIGNGAFANSSLTEVIFGNNLTDIGSGAFIGNNLTDIIIPSSVTNIDLLAFSGNPLANVTSLGTTPPTIETGGVTDTFATDRSNIALHIPAGTMGAYVTDTGALWTGFNPVTEDALSITDFELANDVIVVTTPNELKVITSGNSILENYTIYSITGAKVKKGAENTIAIEALSKGIYILELTFDTGKLTKKFVK